MSEYRRPPVPRASIDTLVADPSPTQYTPNSSSKPLQLDTDHARLSHKSSLDQLQDNSPPSPAESSASFATATHPDEDQDIEKEGHAPASAPQNEKPKDPNLVTWDGPDDPENPQNFTPAKKWAITMILSLLTLTITFSSSIFSTGTQAVAERFHVGLEVSTLGTSLFLVGFVCGPIVWGPFSELYGRMTPLFLGFAAFAIFQIPVAVAQNIETVMLGRFFGGFFGCAPLAIVGGAMADIWNPVDRGVAVALFAAATFIGPVAGPIVGGFVTQSYLGWRWTAWITLFMATTFLTVAVAFVPETYPPILLKRRAARLRHETKNWALHSQLDEQRVALSDIVTKYLFRPFQMLIQEPILALVTLYMSLVYGILYLFFEAYPISFQQQRGWNQGVGALPFIAITIGVILGATFISYLTKTRFARKMKKHGRVIPEERLPPMIIGGIMFPIGLFWFAWTSSPNITWVPQVISGGFLGFSIFSIFMQGLNYLIDVYLMNANSAIAANTIIRSLAGAGFPLFAVQMYHKLGVDWATTLLAFLTLLMVPVPIAFYIYGKRLRALSKFSPNL